MTSVNSKSPVVRPEFVVENVAAVTGAVEAERTLSVLDRLYHKAGFRKLVIIVFLITLWQVYATRLANPLMFPTFKAVMEAFYEAVTQGTLVKQCAYSLRLLLTSYFFGIVLACFLTVIAMTNQFGKDVLETLTAMLSPLPAVAILPLAMLWFGLGEISLIFVLVNAILWPTSLNIHSGFKSVSPTLKMVGRNYGLGRLSFVLRILIPGALPSIFTGLKVGWAFGWRTLIASELVFGVSSGSGGLGWFIYENKNQLEIPAVFAGLLAVILIGLLVENLVFQKLQERTVERWGMQV